MKKFFHEKGRRTIVKDRFLIDGKKVLRWNRGNSDPISTRTQNSILSFLKKSMKFFDKVIISDYRHGLLTKTFAAKVLKIFRDCKKTVYVDSQVVRTGSNHRWYAGADLICLNQKEAASVYPQYKESNLQKSLRRLAEILRTPNIVLKLGEKGSAALLEEKIDETVAYKI